MSGLDPALAALPAVLEVVSQIGGNWAERVPTLHGGVGQAARSRSVGERSSVCQPSTRRMVI